MIEFKDRRTIVSCQGDIKIIDFPAIDGTVWLLLQQGESGEPGRPIPGLENETFNLTSCEGVLIGLRDSRSCEVLIRGLTRALKELDGE